MCLCPGDLKGEKERVGGEEEVRGKLPSSRANLWHTSATAATSRVHHHIIYHTLQYFHWIQSLEVRALGGTHPPSMSAKLLT